MEHRQAGHERQVLVDGVDAERAGVDDRLQLHGSPNTEISPESGRWKPERILISVDLPAPLSPIRPEHLALAEVQADVAQGRDRAEALGDVLDAQHVVRRAVGSMAVGSVLMRASPARAR